ncbi:MULTISPECIES: glutaredoxin 3 [Thiorhodovibrio]|jgi:glutaredoxin 3|uniref:glutaredoxin 3 n=1 Tax=Thiorhodovibrio TaxID=61593 RepID=UPI0019124A51|nr:MULTISPECIES: glutaredoxin 3 [Thiorhodovibrio]MBK5970661.1 glutaredoxin 3 [Thiorhodovibrio winogradskyi]WPL14203.1 Glutaredoxin-3 [Thiorhodovibrio litoralis]
MVKIEMYSTAACPYCVRARRLLHKKGVEFNEIRIDEEPSREAEMIQRSERFTVPQIFIGERHIGGYDDMAELDMDDALDPLLRGEEPV